MYDFRLFLSGQDNCVFTKNQIKKKNFKFQMAENNY